MYTVFVTGPLASGKRAACLYLAEKGFWHIDLDEMSKEFLEEDTVIEQLVDEYSSCILDDDGRINRAALAKQAFASRESTALLNGVLWPLVTAQLADIIVGNSCQVNQEHKLLAVEIPMLTKASDTTNLANTVLCITARPEVRIERALARGMHYDDVLNRMALQVTDEERASFCDTVIENNTTLEELHTKLDLWLSALQTEHLF